MTTWGSACSIRLLFTPIRWQIKPFLCIRGVAWERFVRAVPVVGGWASLQEKPELPLLRWSPG